MTPTNSQWPEAPHLRGLRLFETGPIGHRFWMVLNEDGYPVAQAGDSATAEQFMRELSAKEAGQ